MPKHLKVVILLEFLSCEKHNFTGNPASLKYYVLYKIEPRLSHVFNDLFGDPLKYNISHRFVSKSILILLSFVQHVRSQLYNAPKLLYLRTLTTLNVSYTLTFLRVMAMQLNHAMISFYTRNGFKSLYNSDANRKSLILISKNSINFEVFTSFVAALVLSK